MSDPPSSTQLGNGNGTKPQYVLEVRGDGFQQFHLAEGGRFEIYVPAGVYAIRCLNHHPVTDWSGLKSGSRDLKLEPKPVVLDGPRWASYSTAFGRRLIAITAISL